MAMLIEGKWDPDAKGTTAPDGSFVRAISPFRKKFPLLEKANFRLNQIDIT